MKKVEKKNLWNLLKKNNMEGRHCPDCRNYRVLVNQGYWWCEAGHTEDMNPETCCDYDCIRGECVSASTSRTFVYPSVPEKRHITVVWCDWGDEDTKTLKTIFEGVENVRLIHIKDFNEETERLVNEAICEEEDTLVVCGHGTKFGLLAPRCISTYLIHSENVHTIKAKNFIGLFCHAREFAEENKMYGFFSDMFISNVSEAVDYSVATTGDNIVECNELVFRDINEFLRGNITLEYLYELMCIISETTTNELMQFNTSGITLIEKQ